MNMENAVADTSKMKFRDYRNDALSLEQQVAFLAGRLGIEQHDLTAIFAMLAPLGAKREPGNFHRDHSLRVGLLAAEIVDVTRDKEMVNISAVRAAFFAGLLHDVGKALVPACTLATTAGWTSADQLAMEQHVIDGFRLLRDRFDFTAHVIVWHHRFQNPGYPKELPVPSRPFSEETLEKAKHFGKVVMLADVYDALHRSNSATGGTFLTDGEIRTKMLALHRELLGDLVPRLYEKGVLR